MDVVDHIYFHLLLHTSILRLFFFSWIVLHLSFPSLNYTECGRDKHVLKWWLSFADFCQGNSRHAKPAIKAVLHHKISATNFREKQKNIVLLRNIKRTLQEELWGFFCVKFMGVFCKVHGSFVKMIDTLDRL